MKIVKWFLGIAVTLLLVLGAVAVFLGPQIKDMIESKGGPQGPEVQVLAVTEGRIVRAVSAPGDIEPLRKVQLSARVSAQIVELPFDAGDDVHAGDVVVRLDDKDLLAALDAAKARLHGNEARLAGAQASQINASLEWERVTQLYETNDVPKSEVDTAEANLSRAEADLDAARHAVEGSQADVAQAEESLKYTIIRSPIDGRVTKLNAEVGELVVTGTMNNAGTVILEIADLSEMLVRAQVDEIDIAKIAEGQNAQIYVNAYPEDAFEGTVSRIALQSTQAAGQTKFYDTEVAVYMGDRQLYSGLSATVDIETETAEGVLVVPSQAVVDKRTDELDKEVRSADTVQKDKTFTPVVFVYEDGKARLRPVRIGFSDLTRTSITAGLEPGEQVIVGPWSQLQKLTDDEAVRLESDEDETAEDNIAGDADGAGDTEEDTATS